MNDPTDKIPIPPATATPVEPKEHTHKEFKELEDKIDAIRKEGADAFTKIIAMIATINTDHTHPELAKIEGLESRISVLELSQEATEKRFLSIENTITILQSEHDTYNTFQVQIDTIQDLVDLITDEIDVIKCPVDSGEDDPRFPLGLRVVYFTSPGLESVKITDGMAQSLKGKHGYPITIVTLTPEVDKTNDVPMLIVYPEERVVRGTSNCITYFSSLTF